MNRRTVFVRSGLLAVVLYTGCSGQKLPSVNGISLSGGSLKTLQQRGHECTSVIADALRTCYSTKELPKLPKTQHSVE